MSQALQVLEKWQQGKKALERLEKYLPHKKTPDLLRRAETASKHFDDTRTKYLKNNPPVKSETYQKAWKEDLDSLKKTKSTMNEWSNVFLGLKNTLAKKAVEDVTQLATITSEIITAIDNRIEYLNSPKIHKVTPSR